MHRLSRLFVVRIMHINRFSQYAAQVYIFFTYFSALLFIKNIQLCIYLKKKKKKKKKAHIHTYTQIDKFTL